MNLLVYSYKESRIRIVRTFRFLNVICPPLKGAFSSAGASFSSTAEKHNLDPSCGMGSTILILFSSSNTLRASTPALNFTFFFDLDKLGLLLRFRLTLFDFLRFRFTCLVFFFLRFTCFAFFRFFSLSSLRLSGSYVSPPLLSTPFSLEHSLSHRTHQKRSCTQLYLQPPSL